ncbi:polysaccharide pyruvyl transferase CsaB [Paenalkalicoccus suaedae]|uniref:Polysaccharide pyruvyl transferase CsaB n=1 Tax=Paenalkalicoccus suaedae TaxID=2592382 RepID=A0A859FH46_9BACI|nr:polysaccharide pyruvyl transferase CsaB [Paenalkalicoccus suaedae]QKS72381.1 polysaccharide pyruvyl transferase CsaB [Paenalkalicoccus suaedae]
MRVVLSGYYGFDNVGDEAILQSIVQALREQQRNIEITVLSNQPEKTAKTYGVKAVNRWKLKDVFSAIRRADGVISGGGSLLQDKTGPKSVIYYSAIMWIARMTRTPYAIYAQGIGPLDQPRSRKIVKASLAKASYLSVRDEASRALLSDIGITKQIRLVPDPVIGIRAKGSEQPPMAGLESETYITVSIRDWPHGKDHLKKLAEMLDDLIASGETIVLLPMHGEEDAKTAAQVTSYMTQSGAIISPHSASIEEKIQLIDHSKLLVGMRLHALIFAATVDVPFVAISYDPKIDAFAALCDQPVAVNVEDDEWTKDDVLREVQKALVELDDRRASVQAYTASAKAKTEALAQQVLRAFS